MEHPHERESPYLVAGRRSLRQDARKSRGSMSTRKTDAITKDLTAARAKRDELQTDLERYRAAVQEITAKRLEHHAAGAKAKARSLREALWDSEEEVMATTTLLERVSATV